MDFGSNCLQTFNLLIDNKRLNLYFIAEGQSIISILDKDDIYLTD